MRAALMGAALFLTACAHTTALNTSYDLGRVRRLGVTRFDAPAGAPRGTEDLFAKHLLEQGWRVVERSRLDAVIEELNKGLQGTLSPETTKEIGRVLGVDALLMGEVTSYSPERKSVVMAENHTRTEEPVFKVFREKKPDGTFADVSRQVGVNVRQARNQTPQTFVIDAEVGVVAKLVDVETGELVWAGSAVDQAVTPHEALDQAAAELVKKLRKQWDRAVKMKASPR